MNKFYKIGKNCNFEVIICPYTKHSVCVGLELLDSQH